MKNIIASILFMVSSLALAGGPGCDQYPSAYDSNRCNGEWLQTIKNDLSRTVENLTSENSGLNVSPAEKEAIRKFSMETYKDDEARCGKNEWDCRYSVYQAAYNELRGFEAKKAKEKQARSAAVPRPKLSIAAAPAAPAVAAPAPVKPRLLSKEEQEIARRNEEETGD